MPKIKKTAKTSKFSLRTRLLLIAGFIFLGISLMWHLNQTIQLTFFTPHVPHIQKTNKIYSLPIYLSVPAINLNLPVEETAIQNNTWGISTKGASHLVTSARPTEQGPIILYAHNTNDRFGPIRWLTRSKEIVITTADKKEYRYLIVDTAVVNPTQTSIFFNRKTETLYLYTCDGFADLERFVVIATPKN